MSVRTGILVLFCAAAVAPGGAQAQEATSGAKYQRVISANPFGLLLELFNAEYEKVMGESTTAGMGGSFMTRNDEDYLNADVFLRYYMQERPLEGWAFGVKAGITNVPDHGTYFGFGFDFNRSWLTGKKNNFYVGTGFGLKRLLGVPDEPENEGEDGDLLRFVPTFRLVNVGIAF